ncbi:MAG: hypothetical protein MZV70_70065 [Desulfobacterales bacterium]|nr:hypothetical protein [Desulfobacterales bacterium]
MNFKKLSLAAAISVGVFTGGYAAYAQVEVLDPSPAPTIDTETQAQAQEELDKGNPSSYGAGRSRFF